MIQPNDLIVFCGAGGFIGGHLVAEYRKRGYTNLRAVDIKPFEEWHQLFPDVENLRLDLSCRENCFNALEGAAWVYNHAADMGGMGFIETHKALCMLSVLINTHLLLAAKHHNVQRFFFASSACVYAADKQTTTDVIPLKESDAYPAMPEDGYGWEKQRASLRKRLGSVPPGAPQRYSPAPGCTGLRLPAWSPDPRDA